MKRKTSIIPPSENDIPPAASGQRIDPPLTNWDRIKVGSFSLLFLAAMTITSARMSLFLMGLALLLALGKGPCHRLSSHVSVSAIGLLAFALMSGFAAIYSDFGGSAAAELYKIAAAFSLGSILLTQFERKHIHGLLWGFSAVTSGEPASL